MTKQKTQIQSNDLLEKEISLKDEFYKIASCKRVVNCF